MKIWFLAILGSVLCSGLSAETPGCMNETTLIALDGEWERALLESDVQQLEDMLAEDFFWVHNHAGNTDTRQELIKRTAKPSKRVTRSRERSDVFVKILGSTAVVSGFTTVDRGPEPTLYNFMRVYAQVDDECKLLANHTMAIPKDEE